MSDIELALAKQKISTLQTHLTATEQRAAFAEGQILALKHRVEWAEQELKEKEDALRAVALESWFRLNRLVEAERSVTALREVIDAACDDPYVATVIAMKEKK